MSQNIAHLDDIRDALDFSQKFFGVMSKEQISLAQLIHPLNDLGARSNLAEFLKAGCPTFVAPPEPVVENKPKLIFHKKTLLGSTSITTYGLGERLTIAQMLRAFLTPAPDVPLDEVEKLLKQHKHPIPEAEAEEMLDKQGKFFLKQEGGKDFGLRDDGWANLILVVNAVGGVSVVCAGWFGGRWHRSRVGLDNGDVWLRESRLVVSNSESSNL